MATKNRYLVEWTACRATSDERMAVLAFLEELGQDDVLARERIRAEPVLDDLVWIDRAWRVRRYDDRVPRFASVVLGVVEEDDGWDWVTEEDVRDGRLRDPDEIGESSAEENQVYKYFEVLAQRPGDEDGLAAIRKVIADLEPTIGRFVFSRRDEIAPCEEQYVWTGPWRFHEITVVDDFDIPVRYLTVTGRSIAENRDGGSYGSPSIPLPCSRRGEHSGGGSRGLTMNQTPNGWP